MCRFLAWVGAPRFVEELVLDQKQSLVAQSRHALIGKTPVNADGFGLAWYAHRETPCLYKDIHPAWSDPNLKQIAHQVKSGLFLAHVRASTGMATSRNNCHPFAVDNWSFMHNGQAGGHEQFRQALDGLIPPHLYGSRFGATDSEAIFLIALGYGLQADPIGAMARAVSDVQALAEAHGTTPYMRFAACWSDGTRLFAARMASDQFAPSLYARACEAGHIVSSEPLDDGRDNWIEIKPGTAIEVTPQAIIQYEFVSDSACHGKGAMPDEAVS
jgi:predicted glutamine amidotransferase